jgi:hypothetical protein
VLLLVVVGAVLTLGGIRELGRVLGIRRHGLRTEGTVVDVQETLTSSNMLASYPVVEFSTAEGRTIRFTSRVSLPIVIEAGKTSRFGIAATTPNGLSSTRSCERGRSL